MPYYCAERVGAGAERRLQAGVGAATVLILGVSYKGNVGDVRESPALKLIELLRERGADIVYHDPHVPAIERLGLESQALTDELLCTADIACIVTAHAAVDHVRVADLSQRVIDFRDAVPPAGEKVVPL